MASGRASSVSTWVNTALVERAAKERYLRAMTEAVTGYEAELGALSAAELVAQQDEDRATSIAIRSPRKKAPRARRRRAA